MTARFAPSILGLAIAGLLAGVPFGTPGSTNVLHVVRLIGDELKGYPA